MKDFLATPIFGILLSIVCYEVGILIQRRWRHPMLNPLLLAIVFVILILTVFDIPKETYDLGGSYILFLLGPATVVMAVPLYRQINLLKKDWLPILVGIFAGSVTSVLSVIGLAKVFHLDLEIAVSMLPKSVTTAIGMEISKEVGGVVSLTVAVIVLTGILGAVIGPFILKVLGIKDEVAQGVAMGTAAHAVGTSKAMELGETQGAMSGLSIGIAGLATVLIIPLLIRLLG
ncbi:LrgB family protein [Proteiniclasticum ruminis]|uniref:TIGR00659 family protein n=1 Tax=Proteiniclasticum ruminis TaxID=398199 RepID=A0A1I5ERR6_9CLOT|nr:LrgB family protein [Proteiniclasticum ruminis]SFO14129.1 TIGR00659 family protein [Proteiniclasticum ruminis]